MDTQLEWNLLLKSRQDDKFALNLNQGMIQLFNSSLPNFPTNVLLYFFFINRGAIFQIDPLKEPLDAA